MTTTLPRIPVVQPAAPKDPAAGARPKAAQSRSAGLASPWFLYQLL